MYTDPHANVILIAFQSTSFAFSWLVNATLIFLILKSKRKEFGAYKWLLISFALVDAYYAFSHFAVLPVPQGYRNAFFMAGHGFLNSRAAVCWFAMCHSHSFPVLSVHFLYRYVAIRGPRYLEYFKHPLTFVGIFVFVMGIGVSWYLVLDVFFSADQFTHEYLEPYLKGVADESSAAENLPIERYSTAVFWSNGTFSGPRSLPLAGVGVMANTMGVCYGFMIYAAHQIMAHLRGNAKSATSLRLQWQLFRALLYQALLPLLTAYGPVVISVFLPFLGLEFQAVSVISPICCCIHPWLDGCVLIYTIQDFRRMLLNIVRCRGARINVSTVGGSSGPETSKVMTIRISNNP